MAFTSINIHHVKALEAEHRRNDTDGSDYIKLRAFDVDGESFELNIFADGRRNFEALAAAINEAGAIPASRAEQAAGRQHETAEVG